MKKANVAARVRRSREIGIIDALVIMIVVPSVPAPDFASLDSLLSDARKGSFVSIVVLGQAITMIGGASTSTSAA